MVGVRTLVVGAVLLLTPASGLLGKKGKQKMVLAGGSEPGVESGAGPAAADSAAAAAGQGQEEQGEAQVPEHEAQLAEKKGADREED